MKLLVVKEKHGYRFFVPDEDNTFLTPFIELIRERLRDGYWYQDQYKDQAENLVTKYDALVEFAQPKETLVSSASKLYKDVLRFLEKRRMIEYEDWEIVSTEN